MARYSMIKKDDITAKSKIQDLFKINQKQGMDWCEMAWGRVSRATISNCFRHTGIISRGEDDDSTPAGRQEANVEKEEIEEEIKNSLSKVFEDVPKDTIAAVDVDPEEESHGLHEQSSFEELVEGEPSREEQPEDENDEAEDSLTAAGSISLRDRKRQLQTFLDEYAVYNTMDFEILDLVKKRLKALKYEELADSKQAHITDFLK
ncbi:hypothetical protein BCR43DRAFT_503897 [Syncephalastrum racemosum]|uniref:DDE-1 domain-containing protein n=1 Tax=Syncephalastrum racemosum TaxID=13706 RepID=A0A1X2HJD6_SYNRA|nr:hypothetical protein BCR43DRAFT_503897 [Syncephalastrum racemosum]